MLYCFYIPLENIYKSGSVPGSRDHIFKQRQWQCDPNDSPRSVTNFHLSIWQANKWHKRPSCYSGLITIRDKHTENHHHHYRWGIKAFSWLFSSWHYKANSPLQGKGPTDIISVCTSVWGGITSFTEVNKGELNGHGCLMFLFIAFKDLWFCGFVRAWLRSPKMFHWWIHLLMPKNAQCTIEQPKRRRSHQRLIVFAQSPKWKQIKLHIVFLVKRRLWLGWVVCCCTFAWKPRWSLTYSQV